MESFSVKIQILLSRNHNKRENQSQWHIDKKKRKLACTNWYEMIHTLLLK